MTTHNLASAHNALYSLFNSQGGVSGYKTKQGTVVYWGDILGKTWEASKVRDEGGIRNQSNSDFQMYTLLDQAQMYIDFSAKGYYLQAYTKVLAELKLFGLSRGKINASLIPAVYEYRNADGTVDVTTTRAYAGLDKDGNPLFDDIEGVNHKEAFMLLEDAEYSKSLGGTCIGYSDNHILKLLDDPRVQQIIGFHDKTDDPDKRYRGARYAKNYNGENEAVNSKGETVHIGFNPYVKKAEKMFNFNAKTEMFEGEIGRIAGVRFVETSEAAIYTGADNDCPEGLAVFGCLFLADGAYGVTEITGGGLQTIIKQLGSAGTADPLNQRSTVGWKAMKTAEILLEPYMYRVECCSEFSADAEMN
jgi:hypothetical protein